MTYDCRTCGACCVGDLDDGMGYADCSVDDVRRMSRYARNRLSVIIGGDIERRMTPGVVTERFGKSCGFLRGTPGKRVSCGIYATRPDACRAFWPGGSDCKRAREELGR